MAGVNGINGRARNRLSFDSTGPEFQQGWAAAKKARTELQYRAAKPTVYRSKAPALGGTADAHYAHGLDLWRMREFARAFDRDDPNVGQLVDRGLDNIFRDGFRVDPQTGDKTQNQDQRGMFDEWAASPDAVDYLGELDLDDVERLSLRHTWVDGDCFLILDERTGSLRFEEADRVTSPDSATDDIVHGVVRAKSGRVQGYLFSKLPPGHRKRHTTGCSWRDLVEIPRDQVIHVHPFRKRSTQSRGITAFAPVFDQIGIHGDGEFARLVKLQVSSCIAGFLSSDFPSGFTTGGTSSETSPHDSTTQLDFAEFSPAMIARLRKGETFSGFNPGVTTSGDLEFLEGVLRRVGLAIGIPLEVALLTAKNQSYSALRGVLEQYKLSARVIQKRMARRVRSRVYAWKVRQWVREGRLPDRPQTYSHRVLTPSWPYLDPLKDSQADSLRLREHLASPREVWGEGGRDYDDGVIEIAEDRAALIRAMKVQADELQADGIEGVTWRDLLSLGDAPVYSPANPNKDDA